MLLVLFIKLYNSTVLINSPKDKGVAVRGGTVFFKREEYWFYLAFHEFKNGKEIIFFCVTIVLKLDQRKCFERV